MKSCAIKNMYFAFSTARADVHSRSPQETARAEQAEVTYKVNGEKVQGETRTK